jgi:hypothetical protein
MDSDEREIDTQFPWLVIPYFNGDHGLPSQRPLTKVAPPVIGWLCPAIRVQGVNYVAAPGTYLPDEPLHITVDVDNRGVPNAMVKLQVYWSVPGTGFVSQALATLSRPVAGRSKTGPARFGPIIWTPDDASIPPHFCLLAHVSCTPPEPDAGPPTPSPMTDRHWAQYNLQTAVLNNARGHHATIFWAVNPAAEAAAYMVTARPLTEEQLRTVARVVRAEPVAIRSHQLSLNRASDVAAVREGREPGLLLALERGERQALVVTTRELTLGPQQFTAVEMVQTRVGDERVADVTGSLGLVLLGHVEDHCRVRRR